MEKSPVDRLWYWSSEAENAPYMPTFQVLDSESSHGRYATQTKSICGIDLVRFHGHACDGLFRGMYALSQAFSLLFPDGIIDRTNLRFLSRNSPCLGDVGAYLTGGRVRFGTQDVRNRPGVWYIVQNIATEQAVEVVEQEGFFPQAIMDLESRLSGLTSSEQAHAVSQLQQIQNDWLITRLFPDKPADHYAAREISHKWESTLYENKGIRTDTLYKNVPWVGV